jgi:hypothetical protein
VAIDVGLAITRARPVRPRLGQAGARLGRTLKLHSRSADVGAMRHVRLWLLLIGVVSLLAEAVAALAYLGRDALPARRAR